jgi:hypothetical protein
MRSTFVVSASPEAAARAEQGSGDRRRRLLESLHRVVDTLGGKDHVALEPFGRLASLVARFAQLARRHFLWADVERPYENSHRLGEIALRFGQRVVRRRCRALDRGERAHLPHQESNDRQHKSGAQVLEEPDDDGRPAGDRRAERHQPSGEKDQREQETKEVARIGKLAIVLRLGVSSQCNTRPAMPVISAASGLPFSTSAPTPAAVGAKVARKTLDVVIARIGHLSPLAPTEASREREREACNPTLASNAAP